MVIRELIKIWRVPSMVEYLRILKASDWTSLPRHRMIQTARNAAYKITKKQPDPTINKFVRQYCRDVVFLWDIHFQMNYRICAEIARADAATPLLFSEFRGIVLDVLRRQDAEQTWVTACFDMPYPLDAETAAAVEAALPHYVESWTDFHDAGTIDRWINQELENNGEEEISYDCSVRKSRRVEREIRRLVRSGLIEAGKRVSLRDSPHYFLRSAPLLEGRWIDITALELAELGVILPDGGWSRRDSADLHQLGWEHVVRTDDHGEASPIDDASWFDALQAARDRVLSYRGRRRNFNGRPYVNFSLYQKWRARKLGSRLDASVEAGIVLASWNDWVKNQGSRARLGGIPVETIEPLSDDETWIVHDPASARWQVAGRSRLLTRLEAAARATGLGIPDQFGETKIQLRDRAAQLLTVLDGLAAAVTLIRSTYFRNCEIVYAEVADLLDDRRTAIRRFVDAVDACGNSDDPMWAFLSLAALEQLGQDHASDGENGAPEDIEAGVVEASRRIAKEIVHDGRIAGLWSVNERDEAKELVNEVLGEFLSEATGPSN